MTLDEAIKHIEEILSDNNREWCDECMREHEQLLEWLRELKALRSKLITGGVENASDNITE